MRVGRVRLHTKRPDGDEIYKASLWQKDWIFMTRLCNHAENHRSQLRWGPFLAIGEQAEGGA